MLFLTLWFMRLLRSYCGENNEMFEMNEFGVIITVVSSDSTS